MKFVFQVVLVAVLIASCDKKTESNCSNEDFEYLYFNNSQVDTFHTPNNTVIASIKSGSNIAFKYLYTSVICPNIADDGYFDNLYFEVPGGSTSFEYNDAVELENGKCYFTRSCFCGDVSARVVTGTIKGNLVGTRWNVEVNVTDPHRNITLSFNKIFLLN